MIHIVTVHWRSPKWVDVQLRHLERNVAAPYRVYGALNGIDDPALRERFHLACDLPGRHPEKLNELAEMVCATADPGDVLVFLDGDAFPVQPLVPWIDEVLSAYPLVAVRRSENLGDQQPHPCFCTTTVGLWQEVQGDWSPGGTWINSLGEEVTDVGGTLLHQLRKYEVEWLPLLRTNTHDLHPLWYAIYDHRIYHHGAGFRPPRNRIDKFVLAPRVYRDIVVPAGPTLGSLRAAARREPARVLTLRPRHVPVLASALRNTVQGKRKAHNLRQRARYRRPDERMSDRVFTQVVGDPAFYRRLDENSGRQEDTADPADTARGVGTEAS